ncbi:MFS transporter [Lichenibacterium minor]|uniref:MFS transporter n=1 Tax=Lichenibacterium minor TaxID=2316528 RepID=A0A4Q2U524_9HYPH|nr:MFS transporter [Lichenibacterium minor]RYC29886.1 MFS transporter [Lichenibacterium minor]
MSASEPAGAAVAREASAAGDAARFIRRGTREFALANLALFAAGFTTFALIYCVQPIMPVLGRDFGVDAATASLSLSATTQCLAVSMLVASSLSEVYGRKPVMVLSLFASSALMIGSAFAPDWTSLLVVRALAGIAFGGLPATAMAYVGEEMDAGSLGLAMGLYIGGTGLGALGGRLIVGAFTDLGSWRIGLFVVGVLALLSSFVFVLALPASRHFRPGRPDPRALAAGFARHLGRPTQLLLYAEGLLLLGVFVSLYNYLGYRLMAPPYGFSQTAVGLIFAIGLVGIVSSAWVGDLAGRLGRGRVFPALVALIGAGTAMTLSSSVAVILLGMAVVTFAFYGAHTVASAWVGIAAGRAKAQAASLYLFSYYTGSSVVGWMGGVAYGRAGWDGVVALAGCVLLVALALSAVLARRPG